MTQVFSQDEPTTITILEEVLDALRESPLVFGVFFLAGLLWAVFPNAIGELALFVASCVAILVLYPVFGGELDVESWIGRRILVALVAVAILFVLTTAGLFFLLVPGIYLYFRLFLATPAALIDDCGPFEALSASWELTNGSAFAAFGAYATVVIAMVLLFSPIVVVAGPHPLIPVGAAVTVTPVATSIQAYLYVELSESA